jgi:hypothetical protein
MTEQHATDDILARIDAIASDIPARPDRPAGDYTDPETCETVTAEAVTDIAINSVTRPVIAYDPILGAVDAASYDEPEPVVIEQPTVADRQAEQQEAADALTEDAMATSEAQAGVDPYRREREAREQALQHMADIRQFIASKISLPDDRREHYLTILSLYVLHTYSFRSSGLTPYLYVVAKTRGAGKSQVGKLVYVLANNPTKMLNPHIATPAVLADFFAEGSTILYDETDKLTAGEAKETSALLNLGNVKGGARYKMKGGKEGGRVEQKLFAPKVVMGIARSGVLPFPDDTLSRGITLEMVACSQEERRRIGRFSANFLDYRDDAEVVALRQWMELWSLINDRAIRDDVPELPELQGFRGGEVVEPLVTLADLLGGDWPAAIRAAIVALDTDTPAPVDPTVAFMANVKAVLDEYRESHGQARYIPAVDLYDAWKALSEERLNAIAFGKRLGAHKVQTRVTKIGGRSVRAYEVEELAALVA